MVEEEYKKSITYFMTEMTQKEFELLMDNNKTENYKFNLIKKDKSDG